MNPVQFKSNFKSLEAFKKQIREIHRTLIDEKSWGNVMLQKGQLINDQLVIEKKGNIFSRGIKRIFSFLSCGIYKPFLRFNVEKVTISLVEEYKIYQNQISPRRLKCVLNILRALNQKTKGKYKKFIIQKIETIEIPVQKNAVNPPLKTSQPLIVEHNKKITHIVEQNKKNIKDQDCKNKNNHSIFDETLEQAEFVKKVLEDKKRIERQKRREKQVFGGFSSAENFSGDND